MRGREMPMPMPLPIPRSGAATPNYPQSPLRITHDGEFYARLLTRETSLANNPSFRYYGAGPGAVPFGWESHPGTPKDSDSSSCRSAAAALPAITPPPSYHLRAASAAPHVRKGRRSKGAAGAGEKSKQYHSGYKKLVWIKIGFIAAVFRRIAHGKSRVSSSADSSSTASSVQSSSTRWLISGGGYSSCPEEEETGAYYHYYEAPATKGMRCLGGVRPSSWTVHLCGVGRRDAAGWA